MALSCCCSPVAASTSAAAAAVCFSSSGSVAGSGPSSALFSSSLSFRRNALQARKICSTGASRRVIASSYGLPDYGAPWPYQTPSAGRQASRSVEPGWTPGSGELRAPDAWKYGAPSDYGAPADYRAPKGYSTPSAYGSSGVGVIEEVTDTELGEEGASLEDVKELEIDVGDGGGGLSGGRGDDNGGGGGGRGDGNGGSDGADGEGAGKKKISMSQKLTLAYAILVGVGGVIGFAKSGSSKSLMAGGGSASILYYVYLNLPTNPVLASTIGLGISTMLLFVMGSRFKESGKVFPAGVVSLFSLIMSGGYIHGVMRSFH